MTKYVTSADGTGIAYDRLGAGPPVIIVGGLLCDRERTQDLAGHLAPSLTVINFDRRGRGESGDTAPYAVHREVEDLDALIAEVGGTASLYGHSSGAGLALHATAAGLPVTRLVLHEPPYGPDDEQSVAGARQLGEGIVAALAEDRRADAIELFMAASGLPPELVGEIARDPKMQAMAPTMAHDLEVMGDIGRGGTIPEDLVLAVGIPTLVVVGGASPDFFRDTGTRLAELLPDGGLTELDGHDHGAPADVVAPVVARFLTIGATVPHPGRLPGRKGERPGDR